MATRKRAAFQPFANTQAVTPEAPGELPLQPCTITFAFNPVSHQVGLFFSGPATKMFFSPDDAEDVAARLMEYAAKARGSHQ